MTFPRRLIPWRVRDAFGSGGAGTPGGDCARGAPGSRGNPDVPRLMRALELRRRSSGRVPLPVRRARDGPLPGYYERFTHMSFRLDGLDLSEEEVREALARGGAARTCRTCQARRIRNYAAILRRIERLLRAGRALTAADVIRWYTLVACGLSCGWIGEEAPRRLDRIVSAMNSPQLRLGPAVRDIASVHVRLLGDPFVPGFNGILARLLLRYHLGRCGLPPVLFRPADTSLPTNEATLLPTLLELLLEAYGEAKPG
jgi:hypothetical protein